MRSPECPHFFLVSDFEHSGGLREQRLSKLVQRDGILRESDQQRISKRSEGRRKRDYTQGAALRVRFVRGAEGAVGFPVAKILGSKKKGSVSTRLTSPNRPWFGLRIRFRSNGMTIEGTSSAIESFDVSHSEPKC